MTVTGQRDRVARNHGHVVEPGSNTVVRSCASRRLDSRHRSTTDIARANPEEKANDRALCDTESLVATDIDVSRVSVVIKQSTKSLDRPGYSTAIVVFGEQVHTHSPER